MNALVKHWRETPPAPVLIAAYLGYKKPEDEEVKTPEDCFEKLFSLPMGLVQLEVVTKNGETRTLQPGAQLTPKPGS